MRNLYRLSAAVLASLLLCSGVEAQQPVHWEVSLDSAKRLAAQTNRLVLAQFTADWCPACHAMENEVFTQPGVAASLESNYVPVKINVQYFPTIPKLYGVTRLPTTMVIAPTPQGEALDTVQGPMKAAEFVARLDQVAMEAKRRAAAVYAQVPSGRPPVGPSYGNSLPPPSVAVPPGTGNPPAARPMAPIGPAPVGGQPPLAAPALAGPPASAPVQPPSLPGSPGAMQTTASPNPPFGLEGFCPVQLVDKTVWTVGDRRWGAIHRGRTYLFAGADEQRRFLADPDRYAPVNSGNDVVLAIDQGQMVLGRREHGVSYASRIYLFANEASLQKFSKNPQYYAARALQAVRVGTLAGQPLR